MIDAVNPIAITATAPILMNQRNESTQVIRDQRPVDAGVDVKQVPSFGREGLTPPGARPSYRCRSLHRHRVLAGVIEDDVGLASLDIRRVGVQHDGDLA